jgi:GT2 family glycosyltransferase
MDRESKAKDQIEAHACPEISVVVPTCNRTVLIEKCLSALLRQKIARTFEVILVDNSTRSGCREMPNETAPKVRLVAETRQGASQARNAGIRAARAELIAFVDDDTQPEPEWLENLTAPLFARPEVAVVTGQTLPLKLETEAERLFEAYGGFSCGESPVEFDSSWLRSKVWRLPVWQVGTTANVAFRTSVFRNSAVGFMDERLGPGTIVGGGEDLYLFYRLLRAGHLIVYQPAAKVRHAHRQNLGDLSAQLKDYRRGEVAFCLLALGHERDSRALLHLLLWIPYWRFTQLIAELLRRARGKQRFRLRMILQEWRAYLQAPAKLCLSHRQLQRELAESLATKQY